MSNTSGLEIERKWLLRAAPSAQQLAQLGARPIGLEQIYLSCEPADTIRRLRRIERDGQISYVLTTKRRISNLVRAEAEREISTAEYTELSGEVDPTRVTIRKTRWLFDHAGQAFELDIFTEPRQLALLELELEVEDQPVILPPLAIEREVTDEPEFTNYELSLKC